MNAQQIADGARNVPPSELGMYPLPDGYRTLWLADEYCRPATQDEHDERLCRRPNCGQHPVMAMRRSNGWWLYCADHLYGRRIKDGEVQHRYREPIEA